MRNYEGRNRTVPRRVSSPLGLVRISGLFCALMDAKTHLIVSQTTADATPASTEVKNSLIGFTSRIEGQGATWYPTSCAAVLAWP